MIDNKFIIEKAGSKAILGQGGSSRVYMASDESNNKVAIKILRKDKKYGYKRGSTMVQKEHSIMSKLENHPNILNSVYWSPDGVYKSDSKRENIIYNVLELAENGPVSSIVRITGGIEESLVQFMFYQLANAVHFMHSKRIAHLDLKLENILLDKYFNIKLADFGVAHLLRGSTNECTYRRGTVHYMAPEVANLQSSGRKSFDALKADIYSLGVWLYLLLKGEFPDVDLICQDSVVSTTNSNSEFEEMVELMPKEVENKFSPVSSLLRKMLCQDPSERFSIEEVLEHEWLQCDYDHHIHKSLYAEMEARKDFISTYYKKSRK